MYMTALNAATASILNAFVLTFAVTFVFLVLVAATILYRKRRQKYNYYRSLGYYKRQSGRRNRHPSNFIPSGQ